jgi:hypothetical protein
MMQKVYVTKYALTRGILEYPGKVYSDKAIICYDDSFPKGWMLFFGNQAFFNKEDALKQANKIRDLKVASLKKQIHKLSKLEF